MAQFPLGPRDGLHYEYDPPGSGRPTFVFVNALTGNTATWQAAVAPACREHGLGTLCYNFRGQVDSPFSADQQLDADLIVGDLKALLAEIDPPRAILCGLSIGGLYAARAVLEGARATGLVLLNTLRRIGPRIAWINAAMLQAVGVGGFPLLLDLYMPLLTNEDFQRDNRAKFLTARDYTPQDREHGHYKLMAAAGATNWDIAYEDLTLPVLTVTGLQDRLFYDADVVAALRARLPDARHLEWPEAGHLLPQEHPVTLARALVDFATAV
ncbi:MAG: alpha/beta hydrolase [Gammaproteobacteria bacterium]|nr:alpha/beta hydrolase [Gammaproteobacteria bacterium]